MWAEVGTGLCQIGNIEHALSDSLPALVSVFEFLEGAIESL